MGWNGQSWLWDQPWDQGGATLLFEVCVIFAEITAAAVLSSTWGVRGSEPRKGWTGAGAVTSPHAPRPCRVLHTDAGEPKPAAPPAQPVNTDEPVCELKFPGATPIETGGAPAPDGDTWGRAVP